jgi:hypothetical protein
MPAKDWMTGTYALKAVDLWEVSVVTFPANPEATILNAKSIATIADFERLLKDAGFPNRAAKKLAANGWAGLNPENMADELARDVRHLAELLKGI